MSRLRTGKLEPSLLGDLLARHADPDERLVVPPRVGEDAAVIALPDRYLVVATDPITFVTEDLGHYVVTINANDVATAGARPMFFSCVLLFPPGVERREVERTFAQVGQACDEQSVTWVGGHTEVTASVTGPLAVGQMMGEVARDRLVRKEDLRPGDRLLLTKGLALEAASIIARCRPDEVRAAHGDAILARARAFLKDPGIGVVREALLALDAGGVHAMHDPTEGGLAGGLHELAVAAGVGLRVRRDAVPVYPEAQLLCEQFGLDIWGVIASGSLLMGVDPVQAGAVVDALTRQGIPCKEIGEAVAGSGCAFDDGTPVPSFAVDEITRLFA